MNSESFAAMVEFDSLRNVTEMLHFNTVELLDLHILYCKLSPPPSSTHTPTPTVTRRARAHTHTYT